MQEEVDVVERLWLLKCTSLNSREEGISAVQDTEYVEFSSGMERFIIISASRLA